MNSEETFFLALKTHRESKNIEIDEISDHTKINPKYLHAIEEGAFNMIPNVYMRLFIRSYVKYIGADYKQALADYELYTTGKIQPKFSETEVNDKETKQTSPSINNTIGDDLQINYKQAITIALTIIGIYLVFQLVAYISDDRSEETNQTTTPLESSE